MRIRHPRELLSLAFRRLEAGSAAWIGATARKLGARRSQGAVLTYHRILPDDADVRAVEPGMYVRAGTFARHLDWIRESFTVRTLEELVRHPGAEASAPSVALTFDDGWRDNLTVAWPILRRAAVRATIFLVRDWVADGANAEGEFMRADEVREMSEAGMQFGAHTATHPRLDHLSADRVEAEMLGSKQAVEDWTGRACRFFAYPYGIHDTVSADLARGHFEGAVVMGGGWWNGQGDRARIPRIPVHEDMTATRALFLHRLATA